MIIFLFQAGTDVRINNIFKIWKVKTMCTKLKFFKKSQFLRASREISMCEMYIVYGCFVCV